MCTPYIHIMPQNKASKLWFVRITAPHEYLRTKVEKMKEWIDLSYYAVGYHTGKKTQKQHIHIVLALSNELQQQSLNARCKKLFDVKGSDYSSKIWDANFKALSYLYHEKDAVVEYHQFPITDEEMEEVKKVSEVYNEIVQTAKTKASTRIPDRILEEIELSREQWNIRRVTSRIYEGVRKGEWYSPGPMMIRYVEEILLRQRVTGDHDYLEFLTDSFCAKFCR